MQIVCSQWQDEVIQVIRSFVGIQDNRTRVGAVLHQLVTHADPAPFRHLGVVIRDELGLVSSTLLQKEVELGSFKAQIRGEGQGALLVSI